MASIVTNRGKYWLAKNDWESGSFVIRAMVMTSSYTPSVDHNFVSDTSSEITNTNYARRTVSSRTLTEDDTNDRVKVDAADITAFTALAAGDLPKYMGIYVQVGGDDTTPANDDLLMVLDLGSAPAPNGGDYSMPFHADGLCYVG